MSLPDEFIRMARALAFYRKFKYRRAKRRGRLFTDTDGMRDALGMRVDLHSGNVMKNPDNGDYIMTDPFSADGNYADDGYYTDH